MRAEISGAHAEKCQTAQQLKDLQAKWTALQAKDPDVSLSLELLLGWSLSLAGAATSIIFVATKVLSRQTHVCHNKHMFVATKHIFCCDKSMLAMTKLLV